MIDFKVRLRNTLQDKNITASELSRLSGVGKSDISNYLNGKYLPKQDKVYLLAKALGVDPGWLMTGVEPSNNRQLPIVVPDTERFIKLVNYMPQDVYIMVMDAFSDAERRLREAEERKNDTVQTGD